jgi:hypothetical protein
MDSRGGEVRDWRMLFHAFAFALAVAVFAMGGLLMLTGASGAASAGYAPPPTATPCIPGWRIIFSPDAEGISSELLDVSASSPSHAWAVGRYQSAQNISYPLIESWDGTKWSVVTPSVTLTGTVLNGVSARSNDDVWAVGSYTPVQGQPTRALILHWNGQQWTQVPNPAPGGKNGSALMSVYALTSNNAWAVGYADTDYLAMRWNGTEWLLVDTPEPGSYSNALNGVTMVDNNDVWAVGTSAGSALAMHWDGIEWSITPIPSLGYLRGVESSGPNDVWAVGWHYSNVYHPIAAHWDGISWSLAPLPPGEYTLWDVEVVAASQAWAVAGDGRILRRNGSNWTQAEGPRPYPYIGYFQGISQVPGATIELWVAGSRNVDQRFKTFTFRYLGSCPAFTPTPTGCQTGWSVMYGPNRDPSANTLHSVAAVSANDVWAVGTAGSPYGPLIVHWDGSYWEIVPPPAGTEDGQLQDIVAIAANDIWAVGSNGRGGTLTLHWNGNTWVVVPSPNPGGSNTLWAVSATSSTDVWAVGSLGGSVLRWTNAGWQVVTVPSGSESLSGVTAISANDAWAIGYHPKGPLTLHWDGVTWGQVANSGAPGEVLRDLTSLASNDVWAVGSTDDLGSGTPVALHWDGSAWQRTQMPQTLIGHLSAVSASQPNNVWVAGHYATQHGIFTLTLRWNGTQWLALSSPNPDETDNFLHDIAVLPAGFTWVVGEQGFFRDPDSVYTLIMRHVASCASLTPTQVASMTATPASTASITGTPSRTPTGFMTSNRTPSLTATSAATQAATFSPTSVPSPSPTACAVSFTDVPPDHTFYPHVRCLACRGILGGYADGTFRPGNDITRGQLAKVVSNAAGIEDPPGAQRFQDVPESHTFFVWVQRLAGRGHIGGYPCGGPGEPCVPPANMPYFRPQGEATRGQIAKVVSNAAGFSNTPTGQTFEDVTPDSPFYLWVERLAGRGIMSGYPCGGANEPCTPGNRPYFRPQNNATRGQTSKIVANTFFEGCSVP